MIGVGRATSSQYLCRLGRSVYRAFVTVRDRLRAFALSLPGAVEDFPWNESVVKANGKIFVFLGSEASRPRRLTVKLSESHGHAMSVAGAEPTGYGLGRSGWVTLPLRAPGVTLDLLRDWVEESYRIVAPRRLVAELDARDVRP
jgi:predicted DNA-binding protein (MmcQ/YjbR family)